MSRLQRWLLPVLVAIVVVVVGVTVFLGVRYANASAEEKARASAQDAAQTYVVDMFAWNPKNVDAHINTTMGRLTGQAKKDYQSRVISEKVGEQVKAQGVTTALTVQGVGVIENTRDTAKVMVFVNQSSTRNDVSEVQVDKSRLIFGMEKQGGEWKINSIDVLDDNNLRDRMQMSDATPPSTAVPIPGASSTPPTPAG